MLKSAKLCEICDLRDAVPVMSRSGSSVMPTQETEAVSINLSDVP